MSDVRRILDASQKQELYWLLDEADSAVQSWLASEQAHWPNILTKLVSRLRLSGFILEAEGIDAEVLASPKIGRQNCRNRRELLQRRRQVVDRVRKRIDAIRTVLNDDRESGSKRRPRRKNKKELTSQQEKMTAALRKWHKWESESLSCGFVEPIRQAKLADLAGCSKGKATANFFKEHLGGYENYKTQCTYPKALAVELAKLSREGANHVLELKSELLADLNAKDPSDIDN